MKAINAAYLAGVLDSDGSLSFSVVSKNRINPSYVAQFQLTWTRKQETIDFMENLKKTYGGSCFLSKPGTYKNSNVTVKYSLTGHKLKKLLNDIREFVVLKQKQVDLVLSFFDSCLKPGHCRFGVNKPQELVNLHKFIHDELKKLNSKNGYDDAGIEKR